MGAPGWDGNHPQSNRLRWVVVGSGMPDRNWTIGNAEYEFNELMRDNNSYRASIGSVGVRPNGPKIRATPCCCVGCFALCGPFRSHGRRTASSVFPKRLPALNPSHLVVCACCRG